MSSVAILHLSCILMGLLLIGTGFWAGFSMRKPFDMIGAFLAPLGLILALIGVVLFYLPDFFSR